MRPTLSFPALLAVAATAGVAGAQGAPAAEIGGPAPAAPVAVHLDYQLGPGAERCPDEAELRWEVKRRSSYDPFLPAVPGTPAGRLTVRIARSPEGLTATYTYVDAAGVDVWKKPKTYSRPGTSVDFCRRVIEFVAGEFAFELLVIPPPRPDASPAPAPAVPKPEEAPAPLPAGPLPAELPPEEPKPVPVVKVPVRLLVGGVARVELATGQRPAFGLTLDAGFRRGWFSLTAEFHWVAAASTTVPNGLQLDATLFAGALVACRYFGERVQLLGCLLGEVGGVQYSPAAGMIGAVGYQTAAYAGGGARTGVHIPLTSPVYLSVVADLLGVTDYRVKSHGPANLPGVLVGGVAGGMGIGLGASF